MDDLTLTDLLDAADLAWWLPEEDDEDQACEAVLFGDEIDTFRQLVADHDLTVRPHTRVHCYLDGRGDSMRVHWQPPRRQRAQAIAAVLLDLEQRAGQPFDDDHPELIMSTADWLTAAPGHIDEDDPQLRGRIALVQALESAGEFGSTFSATDPVAEVLGVLIDDRWGQTRGNTADLAVILAVLRDDPGILERARLLARDTSVTIKAPRTPPASRTRA